MSAGVLIYDAAGNLTNDTFHTYQYDAEGNVLKVDNGVTATYVYDALNRCTQDSAPSGSNPYDYAYNLNGQRVAILECFLRPDPGAELLGRYAV